MRSKRVNSSVSSPCVFAANVPGSTLELDRHAASPIQGFRSDIGAIWPNNSADFGVHAYLLEVLQFAKWFKDGPTQGFAKVYLSRGSVLKPQPHSVVMKIADFDDVVHGVYSSGSIHFASLPSETNRQFSSSSSR